MRIKGSCELSKFYGNSVMLTSIVLVKLWETQKLGEAQHLITRTNSMIQIPTKAKTLGHIKNNRKL